MCVDHASEPSAIRTFTPFSPLSSPLSIAGVRRRPPFRTHALASAPLVLVFLLRVVHPLNVHVDPTRLSMAVRKALFDAKVELEADVRPKWRPGSSLDLARFARPVTPSTPPLPDFATSETRGGSTPGVEQIHPTPPSHGRMRTGGFMEWLSHPPSGVCGGHHLTRRVPSHPFDASMTRGSGKDHGPPDAGSDTPTVWFNGPFKAQRFPIGHRTTTTRWMGYGR